jgi:hypothetical protein
MDALRLPGDVVQRVVRQAGRIDLEHGLASLTQEVHSPAANNPPRTTETAATGQSRQLVSTIPPAAIINMTPRPSASTPMNLVPPGFDETVTRQSSDAPALIYWLSAGRGND